LPFEREAEDERGKKQQAREESGDFFFVVVGSPGVVTRAVSLLSGQIYLAIASELV